MGMRSLFLQTMVTTEYENAWVCKAKPFNVVSREHSGRNVNLRGNWPGWGIKTGPHWRNLVPSPPVLSQYPPRPRLVSTATTRADYAGRGKGASRGGA